MCVVSLCTAQENVTSSGGQGDRQEQHTVSSWGCVCVYVVSVKLCGHTYVRTYVRMYVSTYICV